MLHTDPRFPLSIGADVTVGHQVMLHGCTIGDGSLIGIQDRHERCRRGAASAIVGAGGLIPEGRVIPYRLLVIGSPGRVPRTLAEGGRAGPAAADVAHVRRPRGTEASLPATTGRTRDAAYRP